MQTLVGLGDVHLKHRPRQIAHEGIFPPAVAVNFCLRVSPLPLDGVRMSGC